MAAEHELEVLREIHRQHARYVKKYFGFEWQDIARRMGIKKAYLSRILAGNVPLPGKRSEAFKSAVVEMGIESKFKNFVESESDKAIRALNAKIKV